jgi:hypothetical protein
VIGSIRVDDIETTSDCSRQKLINTRCGSHVTSTAGLHSNAVRISRSTLSRASTIACRTCPDALSVGGAWCLQKAPRYQGSHASLRGAVTSVDARTRLHARVSRIRIAHMAILQGVEFVGAPAPRIPTIHVSNTQAAKHSTAWHGVCRRHSLRHSAERAFPWGTAVRSDGQRLVHPAHRAD